MADPVRALGILGNGQLGRMMALAAAPFGVQARIYDPRPGPATQVTSSYHQGAWDDWLALEAFAASVDAVTLEFENVPVATAEFLAARVPLRPSPQVLATCQDRIREKTFLQEAGIPTAAWLPAHDAAQAGAAIGQIGPAVLKTARSGYDGKGQARALIPGDAEAAWRAIGEPQAAIVEALVPFECEASVIVARSTSGEIATYDLVQNHHEHHVLRKTIAPAPLPAATAAEARRLALHIARALDLVGLLAIELFVMDDGSLLVNELAPRPHNSGHWTIDACTCSQFEQAVRAACGLPLGPTARHHDAVMHNLLGDEAAGVMGLLADPRQRVHLYGKPEARPGRKMGHVTTLLPLTSRQP